MVTFVQANSGSTGGTASRTATIILTAPPLEDDVIYLGIQTSVIDTSFVDPAGWVNELGANADLEGSSHTAAFFHHIVTAAEALAEQTTWVLTDMYDLTRHQSWVVGVFRGVDLSNPIAQFDTYLNNTSLTNSTIPAITPTVTGGRIAAIHLMDASAAGSLAPSGWTRRATGTNPGRGFYEYDTDTVNGVEVGPATLTSDSDQHIIGAFVIPPVSVAGFSGSTVRIAAGGSAPVRLASADVASIRLADGTRLEG